MNPNLNDFSNLLRDAARQSPGCDCNQLQAYRWQPEGYGREVSMEAFGATTCNSVEFWSRSCDDQGEPAAAWPALFMFVLDRSIHNPFRHNSISRYRVQISVLGKLILEKGRCGDCDNLTANSLTVLTERLLNYVLSYIGGAGYATIETFDGKTGSGLYNLASLARLKSEGMLTCIEDEKHWHTSLPTDIQGEDIIFKTGETYGTSVTFTLQFSECAPGKPTLMLPLMKTCPDGAADCCNDEPGCCG